MSRLSTLSTPTKINGAAFAGGPRQCGDAGQAPFAPMDWRMLGRVSLTDDGPSPALILPASGLRGFAAAGAVMGG